MRGCLCQGEIYDNIPHSVITSMNDYHAAKMIRLPDSVPASAGGLNKTSKKHSILPIFRSTLASPSC